MTSGTRHMVRMASVTKLLTRIGGGPTAVGTTARGMGRSGTPREAGGKKEARPFTLA